MCTTINKKTVDCDVLTLAIEKYFPGKEIQTIDVHCFIAWTILPSEEEKDLIPVTPFKFSGDVKKISVDVIVAKQILAKHFNLHCFHMLYTGNICGTIYFK